MKLGVLFLTVVLVSCAAPKNGPSSPLNENAADVGTEKDAGKAVAEEEPEDDGPPPAYGEFISYELHTTAPDKAVAFYTELFGWTAQKTPRGIELAGADNAVQVVVRPTDPVLGDRVGWIGWMQVEDPRDVARDVPANGGRLVGEIQQRDGETWYYAAGVVGGLFAVTDGKSRSYHGQIRAARSDAALYTVLWNHLWATDTKAANVFYSVLGNYETLSFKGRERVFQFLLSDDVARAAIVRNPVASNSRWFPAVRVKDTRVRAGKAKEFGAKQVVDTTIEGFGKLAVYQSPTGEYFAVVAPDICKVGKYLRVDDECK